MPTSGETSRSHRVLWGALAVALVVIAFLLGRESMREVPPVSEPEASSTAPSSDFAATDPSSATVEEPAAPVAWLDDSDSELPEVQYGGEARIERRPDGRIVISNSGGSPAPNDAASKPPRSVPASPTEMSDYFEQMDAIRAGEEMGDPNAFAMGIVRSAFSGSTEGISSLVDDTAEIQSKMQAITPPAEAADYHEASLAALAQGKALMEDLQRAIETQDVQRLSGIAAKAKALQSTTRELELREQQLRSSP
ncbi:MAG: hypothetical protein AAF997_08690 [Myxococcota bacterium]